MLALKAPVAAPDLSVLKTDDSDEASAPRGSFLCKNSRHEILALESDRRRFKT